MDGYSLMNEWVMNNMDVWINLQRNDISNTGRIERWYRWKDDQCNDRMDTSDEYMRKQPTVFAAFVSYSKDAAMYSQQTTTKHKTSRTKAIRSSINVAMTTTNTLEKRQCKNTE